MEYSTGIEQLQEAGRELSRGIVDFGRLSDDESFEKDDMLLFTGLLIIMRQLQLLNHISLQTMAFMMDNNSQGIHSHHTTQLMEISLALKGVRDDMGKNVDYLARVIKGQHTM